MVYPFQQPGARRSKAATRPALVLLVGSWLSVNPAAAQSPAVFDRTIAPVLATCLECHRGPNAKGGLDLGSRAGAQRGGESGPAYVAGDPKRSLLWQRLAADEMPPDHPLPAADKEVLRQWIATGAKWGTDPIDPFRFSSYESNPVHEFNE